MADTEQQVLQSPNFPNHYSNNMKCIWTIHAEEGNKVQIKFEFIKLEKDFDRLQLCSDEMCNSEILMGNITGKCYDSWLITVT